MPIFEMFDNKLLPVEQKDFDLEKELLNLIEGTLEAIFNCRFVASEC